MLFELRDTIPEVSPSWVEARDAFLAGHSRKAWSLATGLRGGNVLRLANDFILNVEIARACSAHRTYMALVRGAMRAYPHDPIVRLYHARVLLTRGRYTAGLEFLSGCESTLGQSHRTLWATELANMYGAAGFEASCRKWLAAARNEPDINTPLALYTQSCACEGMQQWDLAIELAAKCVSAAPNWTRARAYLANCLLARGRVEEAEIELAEAARRGHEEALVDMSRAMLAMSLGRFDEAKQALEDVLRDWPQAEFLHWVRRTLCILLVELGDLEGAKQLVAGHEQRYALPEIPEVASGGHCYIPLPLVAQNKNQCVPTSVAMAAFPQGHRLDPDAMFREMRGREGTPLWRMQCWAQEHGLSVIPIRLKKEAIVSILAHGVPLIGALEGPFNSHVDVVCGYNDSLQTLYVRDPGHWAPAAWPWEMGLARYAMHEGLYAVVDQNRTEVLAAANSVQSEHCAALLELSQAVAQGDVAKAEDAYARIPDEADAASLRDGYAVNVVISPLRFWERMRAISEDENAKLLPRFRALMSLGSDDVRAVLDKLLVTEKSLRFGMGIHRYLTLQKQMADGQWRRALASVDRLLLSGGGVSHFWELKSDILAELGDHEFSRDALGKAIELEPLRISLREKALHQSAHRMTLAEYLDEFDSLLARDPDDKRLLWARADALMEGPDGREYERAALEATRWFPRAPAVYMGLLNWYQAQGRRDLAEATLKLARERLPDVFGNPAESDQQERSGGKSEEVTTALPDDKDELLKMLWAVNDSRRPAAIERVLEMQRAGQLHWYEAARLAACRLLIPDRPDGKTENSDAILPVSPPGAAHWYARVLCDELTDHAPSLKVALEVNEWLDRVVPTIRSYPELWFQRVLLLEHGKQMERALDELRQLLKQYPAYSSALYRMGIVKYRQEDFSSACRYLDQSLEVNPGLLGAMDALVTIHETMGNRQEALRHVRMLRRKSPYSLDYLRDEVAAVAELESSNAAEAILAEHAVDFPTDRLALIRVRLAYGAEDFEAAQQMVNSILVSPGEPDEDYYEEHLQVRLALALRENSGERILALCEEGLRRWPDSTRLKEVQANQVSVSDPQQARQLLRNVLHQGEPRAQTAWQYLEIAGQSPDVAARGVIESAPEDRRAMLSELFSDVMREPSLLRWNASYLEWALQEFPESDLLRWRLATHYNSSGQVDRAIQRVRELHRRNPEDPEAKRMLGRCLIDRDAKQALPYLEQMCRENRSVEYLFDLARCHQIAGNGQIAQQLHWEIMEQNPYVSSSWTNLFVFAGPSDRLWHYVCPMWERGCGVEDEYFLVATVMAAIRQRQQLPTAWFPLALQRFEMLKTYPGFRDERTRLTRSLLAWAARRPQDVSGDVKLPSSWLDSLAARLWWPRCSWIPLRSDE